MNLMDSFNESTDILIQKLAKRADGKTTVFMLDELNQVTLDVIAKVKTTFCGVVCHIFKCNNQVFKCSSYTFCFNGIGFFIFTVEQ